LKGLENTQATVKGRAAGRTSQKEHVCKCDDESIYRNLQKILRITIIVREKAKSRSGLDPDFFDTQ